MTRNYCGNWPNLRNMTKKVERSFSKDRERETKKNQKQWTAEHKL